MRHRVDAYKTLAVAFMGLLLGGCLGGGPASPAGTQTGSDEPASSETVEIRPGVVVAANKGLLEGSVTTEAGLAIKGARSSLLGTSYFADTDASGAFRFENLTAATYELSVVATGFQAHVENVTVSKGELTTVAIRLIEDDALDAAYRPHLHDYWGEREQVTLMDSDVDLLSKEANGQSGVYSDPLYARTGKANENRSSQATDSFYVPIKSVASTDPPIIFPGSREVQVTFSWTQENVRLERLGLMYSNPNLTKHAILVPKPSGGTWTIAVDPASTDDGHDMVSSWSLYVYNPNDKDEPTTWKPGLIMGPMHIKIVLVKGELFLEPEHPRFWQGNDTIKVRSGATATKFTVTDRTGGAGGLRAEPKVIVPPGTARLILAFWYFYDDPLNGTVGNEWVLTWRTPSQGPGTPLSEYKRQAAASGVAGFKRYELDLKESDWDPFYAKQSRWLWMPSPKGQEDATTLSANDDYYRGQAAGGLKFRLAVTAIKDPTFE